MSHGGKRPGSGRPPGAKNKRTVATAAAAEAAAAAISAAVPGAFDGDAHSFLMCVYRDPAQPMPLRVDAAKAAAKYEKPALSNITATLTNAPSEGLDDADLDRRIARALTRFDDAETGHSGASPAPGSQGKPH